MNEIQVPFVSFLPMERELDAPLHEAFERVYRNSWYIGGREDKKTPAKRFPLPGERTIP